MNFRAVRNTDGSVNCYTVRSDCGRYSVSKVIIHGEASYEAYCGPNYLGSGGADAAAAKRICEQHAAEHKANAELRGAA